MKTVIFGRENNQRERGDDAVREREREEVGEIFSPRHASSSSSQRPFLRLPFPPRVLLASSPPHQVRRHPEKRHEPLQRARVLQHRGLPHGVQARVEREGPRSAVAGERRRGPGPAALEAVAAAVAAAQARAELGGDLWPGVQGPQDGQDADRGPGEADRRRPRRERRFLLVLVVVVVAAGAAADAAASFARGFLLPRFGNQVVAGASFSCPLSSFYWGERIRGKRGRV